MADRIYADHVHLRLMDTSCFKVLYSKSCIADLFIIARVLRQLSESFQLRRCDTASVQCKAGFTPSRALFGKNVGARHLGRQTLFSCKNRRPFPVISVRVSAVSSPEKLTTFFWSSRSLLFISLVHSGVAGLFPACKNLAALLVGAPCFVGAPVRPNLLNMPKSAAGSV